MQTKEIFKQSLAETGIELSVAQFDLFNTFLTELKKWNRAYNLTALRKDREIVIKHFIDSLLYMKAIPPGPLKLADPGTGAGFPGIPIKIARPEIELTLIESSRKKASFLRHIIRVLKLDSVHVLEQRLENLGHEYEGVFDIIVSRAAFSVKDFLNMAGPYIQKDGILLISKGPMVSEELEDLRENPSPGCSVKETLKLQLPFNKAERNLITLTYSKSNI